MSDVRPRATLQNRPRAYGLTELTDEEVEVLARLAQGNGRKEIASEMKCSMHNVDYHIAKIRAELGVDNDTKLALFAFWVRRLGERLAACTRTKH